MTFIKSLRKITFNKFANAAIIALLTFAFVSGVMTFARSTSQLVQQNSAIEVIIGYGAVVLWWVLLIGGFAIHALWSDFKAERERDAVQYFVNPITGNSVQLHLPGQVRVWDNTSELYKSIYPSK